MRLVAAVVCAFLCAGCVSGPAGGARDGLPRGSVRVKAEGVGEAEVARWNAEGVEVRRVPGRVVGGVFVPTHEEAFVSGGRGSKGAEEAGGVGGKETVSGVFREAPLGKVLGDVLFPLGYRLKVAPEVNTSVPVTASFWECPLERFLADVLGPLGYGAELDRGRKEVRVHVR